jgi:hypothetical protein
VGEEQNHPTARKSGGSCCSLFFFLPTMFLWGLDLDSYPDFFKGSEANTGRNKKTETHLEAVGYDTGRTQLEFFYSFLENNNILDQFLNNEEAKYFNTQVCGPDRQLKKIFLDLFL